jgi:hypothetical protein
MTAMEGGNAKGLQEQPLPISIRLGRGREARWDSRVGFREDWAIDSG